MNEIENLKEVIASIYIEADDKLRKHIKNLSDEELISAADILDTEKSLIYKWAAGKLKLEVYLRNINRDATKYMQETGASYYCVSCKGTCTVDHDKE